MTFISEEKINEVKARVDMVGVISKRVELKRTGHTFKGLCPFHNERTPSFHVNPERGFYHCFGCQASGDVFKFIVETEHLQFTDVIKQLAQQVGVELKEEAEPEQQRRTRERREYLFRVNDYIAEYFKFVLWNEKSAQEARHYVEQRGLTQETAQAFALGFSPKNVEELLRYLDAKKIPHEAALTLGVLCKRDDGSIYSRFFDRLMFPIWDDKDRVTGFGGRILTDAHQAAKYLNSPESLIFKKSRLLYGLNKAKHAIARNAGAWLCEGYFDVIALHQAGFTQAVAPLGTALTLDHLPLLRRLCQKVTTVFDGDEAGMRATRKATDLLLAHGFQVKVLALSLGDDPDTLVQREGAAQVLEMAQKALPAPQFFIDEAIKTLKPSVEGRVAAAENLSPLLVKITSQLERDLYVREAARKLGIDEDVLRSYFHHRPAKESMVSSIAASDRENALPPALSTQPKREPPDNVEWFNVLELLKYRTAWPFLHEVESLLTHAGLRQIIDQCIKNDTELNFDCQAAHENVADLLGSDTLARNLALVLSEDHSSDLDDKALLRLVEDVKLNLEHYLKKQQLQALNLELEAQLQRDSNELPIELLRRKRELNRDLKRVRRA